jgi:DNA polymerase-3 subunit alpha
LWEQIETFAAYGFNKAHAASYGNLAYKTAYMKANFPVDYMAAVLTADAGDVEKIADVVAECKRIGITASGQAIRFGLYSIKNFGSGVADSIIAARTEGGAFKDIGNFLTRIPDKNLNKKSLEALIMCGALDEIGERSSLLENIDTLLAFHREHVRAPSDQGSLFGGAVLSPINTTLHLPPTTPASQKQRLDWEKELLGLYVSGHPLDQHREKFKDQKTTIKHAKENLRGVETVIAGLVETNQTILTKNGERMGFLRVADFSDAIEVVAFPRVLKENEAILALGSCVMLKGKISERNGTPSFVAERVKAL